MTARWTVITVMLPPVARIVALGFCGGLHDGRCLTPAYGAQYSASGFTSNFTVQLAVYSEVRGADK